MGNANKSNKRERDLSELSLLELYRVEVENQTAVLTKGLLELEKLQGKPSPALASKAPVPEQGLGAYPQALIEGLMRAAHSLKGAARIVNLPAAVRVAHALEDCFVAVQKGQVEWVAIDVLLRAVDLLVRMSKAGVKTALTAPSAETEDEVEQLVKELAAILPGASAIPQGGTRSGTAERVPQTSPSHTLESAVGAALQTSDSSDRLLRLTAENLNRLLGLAGESLVEARWLRPFAESLQRLKRMQHEQERTLETLRQTVEREGLTEQARGRINELFRQAGESREFLADRLQELDLFDRRSAHLSNRLYLEVLRARMRPFGDSEAVRSFPRMVRDLARSLGKQVRLEIIGENTQVDRDILDRLETPLNHLLRNAVDHGCEVPAERMRAGKSPEATIRLEARHSAGMLMIVVSDDGAGIDSSRVRKVIADRNLTTPALAERLTESELMQFLFLPGFSMRELVTEISGRGVGLDIVQNMVKSVRGNVRVASQPGRGMRFQMQLPLTLSVLRTLLVEIAGEPYAIPLAQIVSTLKLPQDRIEALAGHHHFKLGGEQVGLLAAHLVFGVSVDHRSPEVGHRATQSSADMVRTDISAGSTASAQPEHGPITFNPETASTRTVSRIGPNPDLPIVVLGDPASAGLRYGLLVDRFLGERELVVQPLDARLGKVKDISAAALMEDGAPVLIVDVDDLIRSMEKLISDGIPQGLARSEYAPALRRRKRVLAVDDSLTVRELERKLLVNRGYLADVAVDGMDGWNAVRTGVYDLVITDVDMPRMDGIELATLIKRDPRLKSLPVMIVSYKDREEDRLRGLEAGADYYLTKGSFQDESLLEAVMDLIGEPEG